jgi:hypothetical protein
VNQKKTAVAGGQAENFSFSALISKIRAPFRADFAIGMPVAWRCQGQNGKLSA